MRPSLTRSRRPLRPWRSFALLASLALAAGGCVSQGAYDELAAERDGLERERDRLASRAESLQTSNESLVEERDQLLNEIEGLRDTRSGMERDVSTLRKAHEELQVALTDREQKLAEREQELFTRSEALAAQEQEIARLRATYDGLVGDLESEVQSKREQIEKLQGGETISYQSGDLFAPDSLELTAAGRKSLTDLAERLRRVPERVEIHGHTDLVPVSGPLAQLYPSNWEIAGAMAAGVARVLVDAGVEPKRVVAVSHGAQVPVASNESPETRARNRRIEIRLVPVDASAAATPRTRPAVSSRP
jgi:chemotaxis protein MotB